LSQGIPLRRACTAIAPVTCAQWQGSSLLSRWMIASRAPVLVMTIASVAVGGCLALLHGQCDGVAWLLCLCGLLLAHAANNQLNDLTDWARGIDKGNYVRNQYGAHVLEDGLLTPRQLFCSFAGTAFIALLIGVYLCARVGSDVLWLLAGGAIALLTYTHPLKNWGLGELAVLLVWGPLMTGGTYLVTLGQWEWSIALISAVCALGPTMVILGKHIDKLTFDAEKQVRTLPVRIGAQPARRLVIASLAVQFLSLPLLAALNLLPWTVLLTCVGAPAAWRMQKAYREPAPARCPPGYPTAVWPLWYTSLAFLHARRFGLLFIAALLLAWGLQQF
jgi:1,4-dihydroxy-2-naphthoate octaprenyltransferase